MPQEHVVDDRHRTLPMTTSCGLKSGHPGTVARKRESESTVRQSVWRTRDKVVRCVAELILQVQAEKRRSLLRVRRKPSNEFRRDLKRHPRGPDAGRVAQATPAMDVRNGTHEAERRAHLAARPTGGPSLPARAVANDRRAGPSEVERNHQDDR